MKICDKKVRKHYTHITVHDEQKFTSTTKHSHATVSQTKRLPVNSSHSHLVTRSCRRTVNSSPVNSSHARLITQSTRHKRAHDKTTSTSRNYLHDVRRHPETVLNTNGVITTISVTLMYTTNSRSRRQITLLRKARSTRHNAVKHDGQLVTS